MNYYDMSRKAYEEGWSIFDNPCSTKTHSDDWIEGYNDAMSEEDDMRVILFSSSLLYYT